MNREQALETLKEMAFTATESCRQALETAISALSAENEEESEDQPVEWYCTDCPYFQFTGEPTDDWYGARCNKDNHEASPSMYAIQSLNNDCPLNRG